MTLSWTKAGVHVRTAVVVLLLIGFTVPKLFSYWSLVGDAWNLAIYHNLIWNLTHGYGYYSDVLNVHHLGEHFSPVVLLFVPVYKLGGDFMSLLLTQGLAVGLTMLLLLWLCEIVLADLANRWRAIAISLLMVLFILYRPMLSSWQHQFQPLVLGMPLVAAGLIALHYDSRRSRVFLLVIVMLLLLTRESAALSVLGLAIYAWLIHGRRRTGMVLATVATVTGLIVFLVVMPAFRGEDWHHYARIDPLYAWQDKLVYLSILLVPLGLLPVMGWRVLLAAMPGVVLNLLVNYRPQYTSFCHYDAQVSVFIMAAAIHGLHHVISFIEEDRRKHRMVYARWFAAAAVLAIAIMMRGPTVWSVAKWHLIGIRRNVNAWHELQVYIQLPANERLISDRYLAPHLCGRADYDVLLEPEDLVELQPGLVVISRHPSSEKLHAELRIRSGVEPIAEHDGFVVYEWKFEG